MSLATGGFAFSHLDEIEVCLLGQVQRDGGRDDAHLLALRADQAYLRDANLVVNAWFVADDDSILCFNSLGRAP